MSVTLAVNGVYGVTDPGSDVVEAASDEGRHKHDFLTIGLCEHRIPPVGWMLAWYHNP